MWYRRNPASIAENTWKNHVCLFLHDWHVFLPKAWSSYKTRDGPQGALSGFMFCGILLGRIHFDVNVIILFQEILDEFLYTGRSNPFDNLFVTCYNIQLLCIEADE